MFSKTLFRQIKIMIILIAIALLPATVLFFVDKSFFQDASIVVENTDVFIEPEEKILGLPLRLKIPTLNIDSVIEYVGLTKDGAMDVPKDQNNVGWLEIGNRPGEIGSAVLAGHYGWKNKKPSVFDSLYKLQKDDKIYIEDSLGNIISFTVRESKRYDQNATATEVFGSNDGLAHLNLITCEGIWDETSKSYPTRLVVFTDKEQ
jgi:LPXTG-site transpeptidase (sortase) family protein